MSEILEVGKKYEVSLMDTYLSVWTSGVVEEVEIHGVARDSILFGDDEWDMIEVRFDNGTRIEGYRREFIVKEIEENTK